MDLTAESADDLQRNNWMWSLIYMAMAWLCWWEEFYFLTEWDDNGAFFYRCYLSYQNRLQFWTL